MPVSTRLKPRDFETQFVNIPATELVVSRVALGTRAMGGVNWGGTDESERILTDTISAPVGPEFMAPLVPG